MKIKNRPALSGAERFYLFAWQGLVLVEVYAFESNDKNRYIQSMHINGQINDKNYVGYDQLLNGAVIDFKLDAMPNVERGTSPDSRPYSFSNELRK